MITQKYKIILKPEAIKNLDSLYKYDVTIILDHIERHLLFNPAFVSKSRIKKLRGVQDADFRLRVGQYRIFYNIEEENKTVYVLRVLNKKETESFYKED